MKKISLIIITVFLNFFLYSCSGEELVYTGESSNSELYTTGQSFSTENEEDCCGDEGDILPPPPPPGGGN